MRTIIFTLTFILTVQYTFAQKDLAFAIEAAKGHLLEIKMGELAMTHGMSDVVRQLGKTLADEHLKANTELLELATKKEMALPTALEGDDLEKYERFSKKNAEGFDKAYTRFTAKDHKKALSNFKKEVKRGKDAELKQLAANTIPVLENHLKMSKEACEQVKKK